ncbi:MAG: ABC transporter substrate-binding protein [Hyphomicrobiales bacterium]|nr:ABC transporter substrate-binding protein [Hyphomicrobiales bacterium]
MAEGLLVKFQSLIAFAALVAAAAPARAQKQYDTGASDTEIRIGNTAPYTGGAAAYGVIAETEAAYFNMLNAHGGVNGRKIVFITYDDAYNPTKTVEQTRKLVESDNVLAVFSALGAAPNLAVAPFLNEKKVPQLFVASGLGAFAEPKTWPWTMGFQPAYATEARIYARYILDNKPDAKIAVLAQNDDFGRESVKALKAALGAKAGQIVAEATYESTDPTIDAPLAVLRAAQPDVLVDFSTPRAAIQTIRRMAELNWKPLHILHSVSQSIGAVMKVAGAENAQGVVSATYYKDPDDPAWSDDAGLKAWNAFMDGWMPGRDRHNVLYVYGYNAAQILERVLRNAGDDLTRANVMKQAASLKNERLDMVLPGVVINTASDDYAPLKQMQMQRFNGATWERFGPLVGGAQ